MKKLLPVVGVVCLIIGVCLLVYGNTPTDDTPNDIPDTQVTPAKPEPKPKPRPGIFKPKPKPEPKSDVVEPAKPEPKTEPVCTTKQEKPKQYTPVPGWENIGELPLPPKASDNADSNHPSNCKSCPKDTLDSQPSQNTQNIQNTQKVIVRRKILGR